MKPMSCCLCTIALCPRCTPQANLSMTGALPLKNGLLLVLRANADTRKCICDHTHRHTNTFICRHLYTHADKCTSIKPEQLIQDLCSAQKSCSCPLKMLTPSHAYAAHICANLYMYRCMNMYKIKEKPPKSGVLSK